MKNNKILQEYDLLIADCTLLQQKIERFRPRAALRVSGNAAFFVIPFASPLAIVLIMYLVKMIPVLQDYGFEILKLLCFAYTFLCGAFFVEYAHWGNQEVSDEFYDLYTEKAQAYPVLSSIMPNKDYIDRYFAYVMLEKLIEGAKLDKAMLPKKMRESLARERYRDLAKK